MFSCLSHDLSQSQSTGAQQVDSRPAKAKVALFALTMMLFGKYILQSFKWA